MDGKMDKILMLLRAELPGLEWNRVWGEWHAEVPGGRIVVSFGGWIELRVDSADGQWSIAVLRESASEITAAMVEKFRRSLRVAAAASAAVEVASGRP